jgi:hypothetical protein
MPSGTAERTEAQYYMGQANQNMHKEAAAEQAYRRLLEMGPRDNEFRIAGLIELAKMIEAKGSTQGLAQIYGDIKSSSKNPDIQNLAAQKLQELKGGH